MNARERGREASFLAGIMYPHISRETFQKLAQHRVKQAYKTEAKQKEFAEGFMDGYAEPHVPNCQCEKCVEARADILTF